MRPIRLLALLGVLSIASSAFARGDDPPKFDDALVKFIAEGVKKEVGAGSSDRTIELVAGDFFDRHLAPQLSDAALKQKATIVKSAVDQVKANKPAEAAIDDRGFLTPDQISRIVKIFIQVNSKLKAGKGDADLANDAGKRKQAILDWLQGKKKLPHPDFASEFRKVTERDAPTAEQLRTLEAELTAAIEKDELPKPIDDKVDPTKKDDTGAEILDTDAKKADARDLITRADAALRDVIPAGADERDEPISADQRKAKLLKWVKGEIKGDSFFLSFLSKLAGKEIKKVPDKDLAILTTMIDDIVGKPNKTASPLRPGANLGPAVDVIDDVAAIFGVPGVSQFTDLFEDVGTLVESPGFSNLFRGCRVSRGLRVMPARSRYVIVEP